MSTKKRSNSRRPGSPATRPAANVRPAGAGRQTPGRTRPPVSQMRSQVPSRTVADDDAEAFAAEQQPPVGALYPQILRTPGHSAARSIGGVIIGLSLFLLLPSVISQLIVAISWKLVASDQPYRDYVSAALAFERPSGMLGTNLGLAVLIPISLFLVVFAHRVRPRWLSSVRPGLRRSYLGWSLGVAFVALGGMYALSLLWSPIQRFGPQPGFWAFLVVIVLTSPLQAAGEEYFFRGYLMQALGSLVTNPWFAMVASSLIFAVAHLAFTPALFLDRFAFGLLAALLVRLTGGLEAGIAAHVINNLLAFTTAGLTSSIAAARGLQRIGWLDAAFDVGSFALFAVLAWLLARKMRLQTTVGGVTPSGAGGSGLGLPGSVQ